ncbi:STAS domain-containing protein [Streptomyces sp. NRRL S-87]|uniref:STAS domain-containing protein n=1 Tax=Streptomyces sp. NRRL S-87 TaxID=1463920 RepID=UPI0004C02C8E|nr:STAS domain-containing protein [Streptomyces sp. NRRL S-87]
MRGGSGTGSPGIEVETRGGTAVVRPYGEMDIARADGFRQAVFEALTGEPRLSDVVVDLQHLVFCDSSGLNVLLDARTAVAASGQSLHLAAPRRQMVHLLELTGTKELFSIDPAPPF